MEAAGRCLLKPLDPQSAFVAAYPQFAGARGIFAWSDVATGTGSFGASFAEWYARTPRRDPRPPRLIVASLAIGAPVLELDSVADYSGSVPRLVRSDPRGANLRPGEGVGLILHRIRDVADNSIVLQEYVLLKRGYLHMLTANPEIVSQHISVGLQRLQDPRPYQPGELHSVKGAEVYGCNTSGVRAQITQRLRQAGTVSLEGTSRVFRGNACTAFSQRAH